MKTRVTNALGSLGFIALLLAGGTACEAPGTRELPPGERHLTILQTNDIHGAVDAYQTKDGKAFGGMAILGGIVESIRAGVKRDFGEAGGVLVVDAGDQFQGTLISNFNEGQLVFATMNEIGYDAVVPGNHDYDFGPVGWLEDQVNPRTEDKDPRGALRRLVRQARFPLISGNTYYKASLRDVTGGVVPVEPAYCKPREKDALIDWTRTERPDFLVPYVIRKVGGVRVALIGIDNPQTPQTTTPANVSDLCFREPVEAYLDLRREIGDQADVFVAVMHDGNTETELHASEFAARLAGTPESGPLVHAVIAGHTHQVNDVEVSGIPIIQSGANGKMFGRVDLVYDTRTGRLVREKTRRAGGLQMFHAECPAKAAAFCGVDAEKNALAYEGVSTLPAPAVAALIASARAEVDVVARRQLGTARSRIWVDRVKESPLANFMTDGLRALAKVEIAFMNTGGLRASLSEGPVTYEELFLVLPFNNRGVKLAPMPWTTLRTLLERSLRTCGAYGALMQSGLKVTFEKDCGKSGDIDPLARLLRVELANGELLFDAETGFSVSAERTFQVATLDFLAAGGSAYEPFKSVPVAEDLGVVRDVLADHLIATGQGALELSPRIDGRWKEVRRATAPLAP